MPPTSWFLTLLRTIAAFLVRIAKRVSGPGAGPKICVS